MIDLFLKGGFLMYPIALCSVAGVAILIGKALELRTIARQLNRPPEALLKDPPAILKPLVQAIQSGHQERGLSVIGTRQVRLMERGLSWLELIAAIAPLLGLTGTVTGMIRAFMVIAESTTAVSPALLAGGIWEALITTAAGLLVAIPIHVGHHYLERETDELAFVLKEITTSLTLRRDHGV
jgi:biopolymer transport protein ExbB